MPIISIISRLILKPTVEMQKNGLLDWIEYRTVSPGKGANGIEMIQKSILHRFLGQHYSEIIHLAKTATPYWK